MTDLWNDSRSPWRTADECCHYLRFYSRDGRPQRGECARYLSKRGVRSCKRGRIVLFDKRGVEAALELRQSA